MASVTPESLRELSAQVRLTRDAVCKLVEKRPDDAVLGSLAHESVFFCAWAEMAADKLERLGSKPC